MAQKLTPEQKEYLRSQLQYDHHDEPPPPNTLAVHQIQHELIVGAVRRYAASHPVHMLDVGCGWGDFSGQLDPFLKTYVGIEPSPVELGRFTKRPNRFLVRGVGENMDFLKDNSRNFVLLNSVLDHCFDWEETFQNCLRVLAPGGLLVVSMENSEKLIVRVRRLLGRPHVHQGHLEFFGITGTREFLRPNFDILEARTIGFLSGMHALTKRVPLPVGPLRLVNRIANGFFTIADPRGGHIFFIAAIRKGALSGADAFRAPFRCPKCSADLAFGAPSCGACGLALPYGAEGYLDSIELNSEIKAELNVK
jgi:SAM-dependent methyltransferase